jgi:hypothetical protein
MAEYGIVPTGFARKPLPIILAEIEAALVTEFGPDVIQTSQSPLGQINGLFADLVAQLWEFAEDTYQSYDPDQAEGTRLDTLAKLRLLLRASGEDDLGLRQAITNADRARIDVQDITRAVAGISGVTYAQVFLNETNAVDANGLNPGTVAVAVLGGDDEEIALAMRRYIVPGISTYGNAAISTDIDGFCRSMMIVRPILVPVTLSIRVRVAKDYRGCPPPSPTAIRDGLIEDFAGARLLLNGDDITMFRIRSAIESRYPNVEVVSFNGSRDDIDQSDNEPVDIAFIEMATLAPENVTVTVI